MIALRLIALVIVIFLSGWLGLKMAVPPGYASPLWPPAGLALAAMMLWGRKLWPAILIGSMANEFLAGYLANANFTPAVLISFCLISLGSTLQACVGHWLSATLIGTGVPKLDNARQTLLFFILTGPLSCLIAASVGVSSIIAVDLLPKSQVASAWLNWWVGDSLGVLIICPLVFCVFAHPREIWRARRIQVALPLIATILALALVFIQVYQAEKIRIQMIFDNQADKIDRLLIEYGNNVIDNALTIKALYRASNQVTRHQFGLFAQAILQQHPEIQALEWLPRVRHDQLSHFESTVQAEGYPHFKVVEQTIDGSLQAVENRAEYFPITFIEPMKGNEKVFGFDSLTNPISRESKLLAQKYDKPSLSNALFLMQRTDASIAVLLSIPVYTHLQSSSTQQLTGFISAVILTANLVETALKGLDSQNFSIRIDDINPATQDTNLYNKNTTSDLNASYGLKIWEHQFKFCDRTWKIVISPDNHFLAVHGTALPWMTLSGGLFFSSLLTVLLLTISGKRAHVEALVDIRTAELRVAEKSARESAAQLRTVVESQPECVKVVALDGSLLQMNQAGLNMLEADNLQQLKASSLAERVLPKYRTAFAGMLRRVFSGQSVITEFEINTLKGRRRWLESHAVPMRNTTGDIIAMLSVTRDITERKRAEESQRLAARVFGEAHEGIVITNADGIIIDVNPMFCEITGYSRDEVLGQNPNILQSGNHSPDYFQGMWNSLKTHRHWQGEVRNRKKNGDLFAELLSISVLCDEQGQIIHYLGLFSDITESKQQQQLLELLAHFDPLTRIPNRTLFTDRLLQALAHSKRDQSLLAICFLDLDGFKPVNDEFGHDVGDQVLIEVADRIKQTLREADTVSRHGGDEFAVLLSDLRSIEESKLAISRIHQAILEPYLINEQPITIGVSTGITVYPLDDSDPDTLLRHADQSMYQAKLAGRNSFHLFDANQNQQEIDRHKQVNDIKTAFLGQEFSLYYQPKVNLKSGQVVGVEALIRWVHPERGLISPLVFMPIITASHLEIEVGNWVIKQAWQQLAAWHNQGLLLEVSINISGYHLLSPGFIEHLDATLATQPQLASQFFQLEILESTALDELSAVNKVIKACRDQLGVKVALDDFGTGYSSLTHLRHLPVDCVKIDQSFVRDMLGNPDDFAIVESVISLSDAFHREVVAEGVENHNQVNVLLLMGCELAQGFVIAKPMPAGDIAGWTQGYQPHSIWSLLVEQNISAEKALITIFRIELRQWLNQIHACLDSTHQPVWPVMNSKKSHFGRWLKRAQQHAIYPIQILEKISKAYKELLQHGIAMKHHVIKGEFETAQHYFSDLQIIHEDIDQQLLNM